MINLKDLLIEKPLKKKKKVKKKPKSAKARLMKQKRKYYLKPEKARQELEKSGLPGNVVSKKIGKQRLFFVSYKNPNLNIFKEGSEMKIKVLSGHLTALDKKVVKQMLDKKMESGRVKKTDYFIKDMGGGKYEITQRKMDTGIGIGAGKVLRNYKSRIQVR